MIKYLFYSPFSIKKHCAFVLGLLATLSVSGQQTLPGATETANAMTIGWNLGNTLEAIGGETAWGNPLTTQRLIDSVKAAGFNTIRIPCSWDIHANQRTLKIDTAWIIRVKQVVDYCVNRNLYVILNIHWDGGWLENNCTVAKKDSVNVKQNAYWTQIANYFKNYDGHLLFASANEPNVSDATQMTVLLSYHQTFINAVRATGGNNSSRVLIIQGPSTDIDKTNQLMNTLPTDETANRLMVEIHYYTPYNFCLMTADASWGKMFYYWGQGYHSTTDTGHNATFAEESALDTYFQSMKTKFVDKGIPVIIGEFGVIKRISLTGTALTLHIASREYYYKYLAGAAAKHRLMPVYWDAGNIGNNSMTLFNRSTGAVVDRGAVKALMEGTAISVTGIDAPGEKKSINLFPNPFTDHVNLEANGAFSYEIYGLSGEKIVTGNAFDKVTTGNTLPAGIYILKVRQNETMNVFKIKKY